MPRAISLYVRKGSRCSSTRSPRGSRLWNFISGQRRLNPDLLQRGGLGDGHGKSSLLWIAIIALLTTPVSPSHKRRCLCLRACMRACATAGVMSCVVLGIKQMINPPLLSCQVIIVAPKSLLIFSALLKDKEKLCSSRRSLPVTLQLSSSQIRYVTLTATVNKSWLYLGSDTNELN